MSNNDKTNESFEKSIKRPILPETIALIGGGLHSGVVLDLIDCINAKAKQFLVAGYYDDNEKSSNLTIPYLGTIDDLIQQYNNSASTIQTSLINCIGDNVARKRIVERILQTTFGSSTAKWATLVHPFSSVSQSANICEGAVICAGSVVGPHAVVGLHSIINTSASVDHDCKIGDFAHIAPGSHLCGLVHVGNLTLVGVGSQIIPKVYIGQESIIGAGATVLANVADKTTAVGIVKLTKTINENLANRRLVWIARKPINFTRIESLLARSIQQNHFANFGPCVEQLEAFLGKILDINPTKAVILTNNGSAALHAIIGGLQIYQKKKLRFVTQAFTFPTSAQCNLTGTVIVDIDNDLGLNLDLVDIDAVDGIIVTNVFGHVVDIKKYTEWAAKNNKYLIFDNAATSFTFYEGKPEYCFL
ncbi:unnamed protein product [Rotaria socialis]|uniref:PglD N-terminal domain-containing protein n=1 Tax=Rotaria socialis TaxID=392032 RepID=A0A821DKM1_9BILA|nr:unnamed protein product [Rotaria socialis]CAF3698003.1 unnamed protein product [Rotaria socialis]CAF4622929.1 unnamed protein product [Rotaria socialis]CAF4792231.1 unnamed protein product [Rotaria socialis]